MTTIALLPAHTADLDALKALLQSASLPLDGLGDQFPSAYVIASFGETLVGAAGLERYGNSGLLRSLAVAVAARGIGLGRRLVLDRLAAARSSKIERVYLLTTTAAAYFEKLGFLPAVRSEVPEELRASPEFASACPATAACLQLAP
jgi:N-acetylglutamate synthase-like GNAT family acetyltransferase